MAAGTLEYREGAAIRALSNRRERNQSYIVRLAIVRLLQDEADGKIDWGQPIPDTFASAVDASMVI